MTKAELKEFIKKNGYSDELFRNFLKRFYLEDVNLSLEKTRIDEKRSFLSARQRQAVLEAYMLRECIEELENEKKAMETAETTVNFSTN